jgi:hypothetical protein
MRVDVCNRLSGLAVAEQPGRSDPRVHGKVTQKLATDVTGSAKKSGSNHQAEPYRENCMFMQADAY